jgi:hypothetical protein
MFVILHHSIAVIRTSSTRPPRAITVEISRAQIFNGRLDPKELAFGVGIWR